MEKKRLETEAGIPDRGNSQQEGGAGSLRLTAPGVLDSELGVEKETLFMKTRREIGRRWYPDLHWNENSRDALRHCQNQKRKK